jgi:hypothetical protein
MNQFANADIYQVVDDYAFLNLKETEPMSQQFENYGADGMIMLDNTGSYFILQV